MAELRIKFRKYHTMVLRINTTLNQKNAAKCSNHPRDSVENQWELCRRHLME